MEAALESNKLFPLARFPPTLLHPYSPTRNTWNMWNRGLEQGCLSHIVNPVIKGVWGGGRLRAGNISHFLIWSHLGQAGFATAYSVCSLVVPRLEEAILTSVLKKNFKRPSISGQKGHSWKNQYLSRQEGEGGGLCRSVPATHQSGRRAVLTISGNCLGLPIKIYRVIWNFSLHLCQKTLPPSLARLD